MVYRAADVPNVSSRFSWHAVEQDKRRRSSATSRDSAGYMTIMPHSSSVGTLSFDAQGNLNRSGLAHDIDMLDGRNLSKKAKRKSALALAMEGPGSPAPVFDPDERDMTSSPISPMPGAMPGQSAVVGPEPDSDDTSVGSRSKTSIASTIDRATSPGSGSADRALSPEPDGGGKKSGWFTRRPKSGTRKTQSEGTLKAATTASPEPGFFPEPGHTELHTVLQARARSQNANATKRCMPINQSSTSPFQLTASAATRIARTPDKDSTARERPPSVEPGFLPTLADQL